MDSSPRRSLSLNLDISDVFGVLPYRPMSYLIPNRNMFTNNGVKESMKYTTQMTNKMSYSLHMNGKQSDAMALKRNNNILQSMLNILGSFTNIVAKIPNYMSIMNNTLSVTVVPNGGIISSEYILKNLTGSKEHLVTNIETPANILQNVKHKTLREKMRTMTMEFFGKQQTNSISNEKLRDVDNILPKTWINSPNKPEINIQHYNSTCLASDLEIPIETNMKKIKCINSHDDIVDFPNVENIICHIDNIDELNKSYNKNISMSENNVSDNFIKKIQDRAIGEMPNISNHQVNKNELMATEPDESVQLKTPMHRSSQLLSKPWKKCNTVARSRSKGRGKLQLRKSGVSQLKHRKKKLKQNIYCNIQDDMSAWVEEEQDFSNSLSENCNTSTSSTIDNYLKYNGGAENYAAVDSDYPTLIQNFSLFDQAKSLRRMTKKIMNCPVQSSHRHHNHETITCNLRSRLPSESSIESEDSCIIVFQNESESECTDYNYILPSYDESESDDNDEQLNHKVRFTLEPTIHLMIKWDFAYRAARRGPWEEVARDRDRFHGRINCVSKILNPILQLQHRERIYHNRFVIRD